MVKASVPEGWCECKNAGTVVENTFLPFKTPLNTEFERRLDKESHWSTESVFELAKGQNMRIGLWIDLTNTERYYDKADVEKHTKYVKLKVGGGGDVPPGYLAVQEFNSQCKAFLEQNPENAVIAVHCTHGLNRTGFLICSFLIQVKKMSVQDAYAAFTASRPPGIFRQGYVAKLWTKYATPALPSVPSVVEPPWSKGNKKEAKNKT